MLNTNWSETTGLESLTELVYELLDAHGDTARLAEPLSQSCKWAAHLDYLQALQRVARETLAHVAGPPA